MKGQNNSMQLSEKHLMVNVKADIRERLLLVAIKLFSEKGVEAVSMRAINIAAGTKNKSAVHYHFGNKDGILKAIFEWVGKQVEVAVQDLWVQIEQREDKNDMSVQELMLVLYAPLILVQQIPQCGNDIFKLLSKLLLDSNEETKIANDLFQSHLLAVYERVAHQLPEKNKEHLRFQLIHSVFGFIAGTAILDSKILIDIKNARIEDNQEMLFAFIDFASGGISNTQASQEQIDLEFWINYFSKHAVLFG
jgi:AcrR family transcriptional regulator